WGWSELQTEKAIVPYLALLNKYPDDPIALNNISAMYARVGRLAEASDMSFRAVAARGGVTPHTNLLFWLRLQGRMAEADSILGVFDERYPGSPEVALATSDLAAARRDFDASARAAEGLLGVSPDLRASGLNQLAEIAQTRGQLGEAGRRHADAWQVLAQAGSMSEEERDLLIALDRTERAALFGPDPRRLAAEVENLWRRNVRVTAGRPVLGRRYPRFVLLFVRVQQPAAARRLLEEYRAAQHPALRTDLVRRAELVALEGEILLAEGRTEEAVGRLRAIRQELETQCQACGVRLLAQAHERAGALDSAAAQYQRFAGVAGALLGEDQWWLAPVLRRLGELHEGTGDRAKAVEFYGRFVDLWKNADAELQPLVSDARQRMARLAGEGR
ncbi:MAG TPA: hypothetical protein VD793_01995, partial [Gemmatimonadales bacterium]|nr:hypothetical protein [Gemmatimonadales bacterium]